MVAELADHDHLGDSWRQVFEQVPRHLFVPDQVWVSNGDGDLIPLDRANDPGGWLDAVYRDQYLVTQADDGRTSAGDEVGTASSSTSMPSVMALMLNAAEIADGMRVLEIGTGTGWNAGLLATRLGEQNVVSVEVDTELADTARKALSEAGLHPTVVTADGADGYSPEAPYDRVMATCAVRTVPHAWVFQTRPGGMVITPWRTEFCNGALARLTVAGDGTASGRFNGNVAFMALRSQRLPAPRFGHVDLNAPGVEVSSTALWPVEVDMSLDVSFAIGLRVPGCRHRLIAEDDDLPHTHYTTWLSDPDTGSWAAVVVRPDVEDRFPVHQHGPRRLWDEVETAHDWWIGLERPEHTRFGLTVTPDEQRVWLDDPEATVAVTA